MYEIKNDINETKMIIGKNIESVINRSEKLETLIDKSEQLENKSVLFRKRSIKFKCQECFQLYKTYLLCFILILLLLYLIISSICGFDWKSC